jgi:hypothetical protein
MFEFVPNLKNEINVHSTHHTYTNARVGGDPADVLSVQQPVLAKFMQQHGWSRSHRKATEPSGVSCLLRRGGVEMEFLTGKILCSFALPLRWAGLTRVNEGCAWTLIDLLACVRHGNAATSHPCHA